MLMLSRKDAFKVGFLSRCVEQGMSLTDIHGAVKEAHEKLAAISDKLVDAASTGLKWGIPSLLAAPPILGGLAGYTAARLGDIDDRDVDDVKGQELIGEYQRQTERLNREKKTRLAMANRPKPGRVFL